MIRSKSIFSIVIILVFLVADNLELRNILPGGYYFRATIIYLAPAMIGMFSLLFFHEPKNILRAMGIQKGFFKGLGVAFVFTLPMLIGYAWVSGGGVNELATEMNFQKFYWGIILAPLAEELFYRGFLFGQLYRFGGWGFIPAGLLSALIFGSMHLYQANDLGSAIGIFAMTGMGGMWFAWLYIEWERNLWLSIFLHFFMNCYWGIFGMADNAAGGFYANLFRIITIMVSVMATFYLHKKLGKKEINPSTMWKNSNADFELKANFLKIGKSNQLKNVFLILAISFSQSQLFAQSNSVAGIVFNEKNEPLSYVNIGIIGTSLGTVSGENGDFKLYFDETISGVDTVRFSSIGFSTQDFSINKLRGNEDFKIEMKVANNTLTEIVVLPDFEKTKTKGNKNTDARMNVYYSISEKPNQNLGAEIGRKFKIKKTTQLKKVRFFVAKNNFDTVGFRINIYHFKKSIPGKNILTQNIIKEVVGKKTGWMEVDLTPYQIISDQSVVVGIEWIYHSKNGRFLTLPISVPSVGSVHFYKYGSQNKWKRFNMMSSAMQLEMAY